MSVIVFNPAHVSANFLEAGVSRLYDKAKTIDSSTGDGSGSGFSFYGAGSYVNTEGDRWIPKDGSSMPWHSC